MRNKPLLSTVTEFAEVKQRICGKIKSFIFNIYTIIVIYTYKFIIMVKFYNNSKNHMMNRNII